MGYIPGTRDEGPCQAIESGVDRLRRPTPKRAVACARKMRLIDAALGEDALFTRDKLVSHDAGVQRRQDVYDICRHAARSGTGMAPQKRETAARRLFARLGRMLCSG